MALSKGFEDLAARLQEAATSLSHDDIRSRLSKKLQSKVSGTGDYAYPVDVFGDDESGDVVYSHNGKLKRAPYQMGSVEGKPDCDVDMESAEEVHPRTVYESPATDDDHMTAMESGGLYATTDHLYERFISKGERDKADAGDFAGKGKSFPILKPEDVSAAVHAMGRAGSNNLGPSGLKSRIIAIAKRKGWTSHLPKSWQSGGGTDKEARSPEQAVESASIEITGDVIPLKEGAVGQDGTAYLKLIAPGRGSCGYYPAEVIERDGPKIFKKGTKNFWNHQTDAEEAARPEGDLRDLASVLTEDAHYEKEGPAGPGLYAKAKVFENFRQPVDDLAKHIGMSIRASGKAKEGKAPDGKTGPIIEQLTRGISVDYVTTPGAGGKVLQLFEAARGAAKFQESKEAGPEMDQAEITKLQESTAQLALENRKLRERFALNDAADEGKKYFTTVRVGEAIQERVLGRVLAGKIPLTEAGDIDKVKFVALMEAETKDEVAYVNKLSGGKVVVSMGSGEQPALTEAEKAQQAQQRLDEGKAFGSLFGFDKSDSVGNRIMREGRSAFDPSYNAADKQKEVVQ